MPPLSDSKQIIREAHGAIANRLASKPIGLATSANRFSGNRIIYGEHNERRQKNTGASLVWLVAPTDNPPGYWYQTAPSPFGAEAILIGKAVFLSPPEAKGGAFDGRGLARHQLGYGPPDQGRPRNPFMRAHSRQGGDLIIRYVDQGAHGRFPYIISSSYIDIRRPLTATALTRPGRRPQGYRGRRAGCGRRHRPPRGGRQSPCRGQT